MPKTTQRPSIVNVRTHTTKRMASNYAKHELYMKLTSLEIERSRRSVERQATADRIHAIDQRIAAIDAEQAEIGRILDSGNFSAAPNVKKPSSKRNTLNFNY